MNEKEKQIEEMATDVCRCLVWDQDGYATVDCLITAKNLHHIGYRKQSDVIDEFVERLKEAPIKCALPLLGLTTRGEIEEYFDDIMLQVRDAIIGIAKEMKGGTE